MIQLVFGMFVGVVLGFALAAIIIKDEEDEQ